VTSHPDHLRVDADFAHEVLDDLYAYRRKRRAVAWLLWALLGWAGGHRFYLERPGTGLLMLVTGGGALIWWIADGWRIGAMVRQHNDEQADRQRRRLPPIELAFMPPLAVDVLHEPPAWTAVWARRGRAWRAVRLIGDLLVLLIAGSALGALVGTEGGAEGVFAVVALVLVTLLGGHADWLMNVPVARALVRWSHRLRLFYYFNRPGNPVVLLLRAPLALVFAIFRRRDRAEARLYLELGAVFTLGFMLIDLAEDVAGPFLQAGVSALAFDRLLGVWMEELLMTFLVVYAFAAPIGAVLTLYLLTRRTHTVPRILGAFALFCIALGAGLL
jgi:hypothetical protein